MSRWFMALCVVGLFGFLNPGWAKDLPGDIQELLAQEKYAAAVAPLTEFLEKDKKNLEGWTALGRAYYGLDRFEDAAAAYERAVKIRGKHWPAVHGYVRTLTSLGEYDTAFELVRKAITDSKKEDQVQAMFYHDLGLIQLSLGMQDTTNVDQALLDSAETNFYVAGAQAPDSCEFRLDRGEIQFARRRYPMAISAYEEVLQCNAEMAGPVYYRIARAYLYQRDFKQAVQSYRKSADARPTGKVYSDLGDAMILYSRALPTGDTAGLLAAYDEAIAAYARAKELAPGDCRIFEKVGKAEALMGRREAAAEDFKAAIECGSRDPNVFFALGNVLMGLARFQETLDWYDRYRELRESNLGEQPWSKPDADFFANYAKVLRVMADSTDAEVEKDSLYHASIRGYERALSLDETRADILDDLGIAYYQMGEYPEAIRVFRKKIEMEPHLTNGYLNLAYAFLQQKKYDSVLAALEGMLAVDSCNQQAFEIGGYVAAFEKQNGSVARQWYNRQLACDPTNCDAKMYIGYTYLVTNDTAQIRRCVPVLQESYECRLAKGEAKCGENIKQNALWLAEAYLALRNLDRAVEWAGKVLACEPGNSRAKAIKEQAESEY